MNYYVTTTNIAFTCTYVCVIRLNPGSLFPVTIERLQRRRIYQTILLCNVQTV